MLSVQNGSVPYAAGLYCLPIDKSFKKRYNKNLEDTKKQELGLS